MTFSLLLSSHCSSLHPLLLKSPSCKGAGFIRLVSDHVLETKQSHSSLVLPSSQLKTLHTFLSPLHEEVPHNDTWMRTDPIDPP